MAERIKKDTDQSTGSKKPLFNNKPVNALQNTVGQYNIVFDRPPTPPTPEKRPEKNTRQ